MKSIVASFEIPDHTDLRQVQFCLSLSLISYKEYLEDDEPYNVERIEIVSALIKTIKVTEK